MIAGAVVRHPDGCPQCLRVYGNALVLIPVGTRRANGICQPEMKYQAPQNYSLTGGKGASSAHSTAQSLPPPFWRYVIPGGPSVFRCRSSSTVGRSRNWHLLVDEPTGPPARRRRDH